MSNAPKWLDEALAVRLPQLAAHTEPSPEATAAIEKWYHDLQVLFMGRGLASPDQQRNRLTDVRNAIKARFGEDHPALAIVKFSEQTWWEINERQQQRRNERQPQSTDMPASAPSPTSTAPSAAQIRARLQEVRTRRDALRSEVKEHGTKLEAQRTRFKEVHGRATKGGPEPLPTEAEATKPGSAAEAAAVAQSPTTPPSVPAPAKPKGPGFISKLLRAVGSAVTWPVRAAKRRFKGQPEPAKPRSQTDDAPAKEHLPNEAAETPAPEATGAAPEATSPELEQQLKEIMAEITKIEGHLSALFAEIQKLEEEITALEKALAEAEAREAEVGGAGPHLSKAEAVGASAAAAAGQGDTVLGYALSQHGAVSVVFFDAENPQAGFTERRDPAVRDHRRAFLVAAQGEHFIVPHAMTDEVTRAAELIGGPCDAKSRLVNTTRLARFVPASVQSSGSGRWQVSRPGVYVCGNCPHVENGTEAPSELSEIPMSADAPEEGVPMSAAEKEIYIKCIALADGLLTGQKIVLCDDHALLPQMCPKGFRVTDLGVPVLEGQAAPPCRLDAILDLRSGQWVESVDHPIEEARGAVQQQAARVGGAGQPAPGNPPSQRGGGPRR